MKIFKIAKEEFSWVSINIPKYISNMMTKLCKEIDKDDLYQDTNQEWEAGIVYDHHITIKYGLHTNSVNKIKKAIGELKSGEVILGKVSLFKNEKYDVLKINIKSDALRKINKALKDDLDATDEYEEKYQPHITLAYLKSGTGDKYSGTNKFENKKFIFNEIVFEDEFNNKTKIQIPLKEIKNSFLLKTKIFKIAGSGTYLDIGHYKNARDLYSLWVYDPRKGDIVYDHSQYPTHGYFINAIQPPQFGVSDLEIISGRIDHLQKIISFKVHQQIASPEDIQTADNILRMDYPDYSIKVFNS